VYSGELSASLLRPAHAVHQVIARAMAQKAYRLLPLAVLVPVTLVVVGASLPADPGAWLLAVEVTLLARSRPSTWPRSWGRWRSG
jgi:ABC-type uncharacterized transport system permease subunit